MSAWESDSEINAIVEHGITAVKNQDLERARQFLSEAVRLDPLNERAWLWLSATLATPEHRRFCLQRVLSINPGNASARQGLQLLDQQSAAPAPTLPARPAASLSNACPWCGAHIPSLNDLNCPQCQHPLEFECPACEAGVEPRETFCPQCRHPMGDFRQRREYLTTLAEAYRASGKVPAAIALYDYIIELNPRDPASHLQLAALHAALDRMEDNLAAIERVLELDPDNVDALRRLGEWHIRSAHAEQAQAIVQRLQQHPNPTPEHLVLLGDLEQERGDYRASFRAYRRALGTRQLTANRLAHVHYQLGEMYLLVEDLRAALKSFEACVVTRGDDEVRQAAQERINELRPPLPDYALRSHGELLRVMAGPLVLVWLTGLLHIGFQFGYITPVGGLGFGLALPGSYLLASAQAAPLAAEWRGLLGPQGLRPPALRAVVTLVGGGLTGLAFALTLFGM